VSHPVKSETIEKIVIRKLKKPGKIFYPIDLPQKQITGVGSCHFQTNIIVKIPENNRCRFYYEDLMTLLRMVETRLNV
jgi:hypothetical protein